MTVDICTKLIYSEKTLFKKINLLQFEWFSHKKYKIWTKNKCRDRLIPNGLVIGKNLLHRKVKVLFYYSQFKIKRLNFSFGTPEPIGCFILWG